MGDGLETSSVANGKRKKNRDEEMITELNFGKDVSKKKKLKKEKSSTIDCSTDVAKETSKKVKSKKKKKNHESNTEKQLLISDVTDVVKELFDDFQKEKKDLQSEKARKGKSKKKKKKERSKCEENYDAKSKNHKIFNDDDFDLVSSSVSDVQNEEKNVKYKSKISKSNKKENHSSIHTNTSNEPIVFCSVTSSSVVSEEKKASEISVCDKTDDRDTFDSNSQESNKNGKKKKSKEKENKVNQKEKKVKKKSETETNEVVTNKKPKKNGGEVALANSDLRDNNCSFRNMNLDAHDEKEKRKKKNSDKVDNDIDNKLKQDQDDIRTSCNAVRKKNKDKNKSKFIYEKDKLNDSDDSKSETCSVKERTGCKKRRKDEGGKEKYCENEIIPVKRKKKDGDNSTKTPFQLSLNSPVFESEERHEKFKRVLGGEKVKDLSSNCALKFDGAEQSATNKNNNVPNENGNSTSALSAGQWNGMMFENAERQNKFIRLLGGAKSCLKKENKKILFSASDRAPKKGLFGSLESKIGVSGSDSLVGSRAFSLQAANSLNQRLEEDYNRALTRRLDGMGSTGIGFVKDPSEGKKFHIDTSAVKSTKFSDCDE